MANSQEKQKEKIILNLITEKTKIEMSLSSLKESLLKLQEGKDGTTPYWNGKNAYPMVSKVLSEIDKNYALLDYIDKCIESIKK
jgi:hypothetical protein